MVASSQPAALLSCYDKTDLAPFAAALARLGLRLLASKGTRTTLEAAGVASEAVETYTGQTPGTLAKTLQQNLHEGMLVDQNNPAEMDRIEAAGIAPVRLVYCDIYPLRRAVEAGELRSAQAASRLVDVGGPALLTCAARAFRFVYAVTDREDFPRVLASLADPLEAGLELRRALAAKTLNLLGGYYAAAAESYASHRLSDDLQTPQS